MKNKSEPNMLDFMGEFNKIMKEADTNASLPQLV